MLTIIVLLLILALAGMFLYFDRKLSLTKHQMLLISKQNKELKDKLLSASKVNKELFIRYSLTTPSDGITQSNASLFIAPYENSIKINLISEKLAVKIQEEAEVNNETWYFVSLPISTNVNSKGWMKKSDFSLIFSSSKDVVNS